jgi:hypothetical protein
MSLQHTLDVINKNQEKFFYNFQIPLVRCDNIHRIDYVPANERIVQKFYETKKMFSNAGYPGNMIFCETSMQN